MSLATTVIFGVPLFLLFIILMFVTINRYITYRERVALAQLGFRPEDIAQAVSARRGHRGVLWGGVITAMSGLALLLGLSPLGIGIWLIAGLLPLCVGLGMILIYFWTGTPSLASIPRDSASTGQDMEDACTLEETA